MDESGRRLRRFLKLLAGTTASLGLVFVLFLFIDYLLPLHLVDPSRFATTVVDSEGSPLRSFADSNGVWRYPVRLDQVSPRYVEALVGYEDRWFRFHPGVNPFAIFRAAWQNLSCGRVISGGSTLTMQVAGLLDPYERTFAGKFRQVFRALQLERHLDKDEILALYINLAPFGGPLEGVQAACYSYLGKSARYLSHAEAALLTVLPQAPSRLRPDRHPQRARAARDKVLARLVEFSIWDQETVQAARQENVLSMRLVSEQQAPLLARRLYGKRLHTLKGLEKRERAGSLPEQLTRLLEPIRTNIDGRLQHRMAGVVERFRSRLPAGCSVAVLVVRNEDMAVRGYLGSARFGDGQSFGHVDMVRAVRSPGSTLKPFLYGLALEKGLIHSASLLSDVPLHDSRYAPRNFGGGYSGPVAAREALRRSLNVPAVQLLNAVGAKPFADRLRNGGLELFLPGNGRPTPAIILGGCGVRLEELVGIYSALARKGISGRLRLQPGEPLLESYLLSPESAWIVRQMLSDNESSGAIPLAWKTGTSYGYRDAWALAVTPRHSLGVWVGRPDGSPSPGQYGQVTAWPLLRSVAALLADRVSFSGPPPGVEQQKICWPLGTSAARPENQERNCHQSYTAWTINGHTPPTLTPPMFAEGQVVGSNPAIIPVDGEGRRVSGRCLGQRVASQSIALWPQSLEPWLPTQFRRARLLPPYALGCLPEQPTVQLRLRITSLVDRMLIKPRRTAAPEVYRLQLQSQGGYGRVSWYLDGRLLDADDGGTNGGHSLPGPGEYRVAAIDSLGQRDEVMVTILPHSR